MHKPIEFFPNRDENGFIEIDDYPGYSEWHNKFWEHIKKIRKKWKKPEDGNTLDTSWPWINKSCRGTCKYYYYSSEQIFSQRFFSRYLPFGTWIKFLYQTGPDPTIVMKLRSVYCSEHGGIEYLNGISVSGKHIYIPYIGVGRGLVVGFPDKEESVVLDKALDFVLKGRIKIWKGYDIRKINSLEEYIEKACILGIPLNSLVQLSDDEEFNNWKGYNSFFLTNDPNRPFKKSDREKDLIEFLDKDDE